MRERFTRVFVRSTIHLFPEKLGKREVVFDVCLDALSVDRQRDVLLVATH